MFNAGNSYDTPILNFKIFLKKTKFNTEYLPRLHEIEKHLVKFLLYY